MANPFSTLAASFRAAPENLKGMGFMLTSATTISSMNGIVQHLSSGIHIFEIAFFRQLIGFLFMAAVFLRGGLRPLATKRFGLHVLRSILNVIALLAFFYGLSVEPIAKVQALSLTSPLFASLGAVLLLGEKMTVHRWIALGIGFFGALVILRPGLQTVSLGALMVLLSNSVWACALVVIKMLSRTESSVTITLYASLLQSPAAFAFAIFFWQWPTLSQLLWMTVIGVFGTLAQLCLSEAFRRADATLVLPLDFTKVIWASLIGYVFFDQVPEIWIWIGAMIVFSAVVYNAYHGRARP